MNSRLTDPVFIEGSVLLGGVTLPFTRYVGVLDYELLQ